MGRTKETESSSLWTNYRLSKMGIEVGVMSSDVRGYLSL